MVYYFSGSLTKDMVDLLKSIPDFKAIDVLVSQLDRSAIKSMIEYKKDGFIKTLFIDSGAFSNHTGKANVQLEEYIDYLNGIDEYTDIVAQLDTIPGTFGKPKSVEDYQNSAKLSWENFLYMYKKLKSPEKLIPVFHYGESFDVLRSMLEWKDEDGKPLTYLGISPANDSSQKIKNVYLKGVYDIIAASSNPNVKTHLFGMTSIDGLSKVPAYSADSISHRLIAGYCKILHPEFGVISVSKRDRTTRSKSNLSFIETADDLALKKLKDYVESIGMTLEQIQESSSARVALTMYSIMKMTSDRAYDPSKVSKTKKLFSLPD